MLEQNPEVLKPRLVWY